MFLSREIRIFAFKLFGVFIILGGTGTAHAALNGPQHFVEPTAIPSFGPNNYIPTFGDGPGNVFGVEDPGTPDVTSATNLWTLGDAHTTRQEWSDLYARRVSSYTADINLGGLQTDGSDPVFSGTITATAPGYITSSGNFYSFGGDFTGTILAGNYGGATGARDGGTFVLFQTSSAVNPDSRPMYAIGNPDGSSEEGYDPLGIEITKHDGSPLPGGASVLHWGLIHQSLSEPSPHGEIPWQENLWTIWMPEWTGDFRIHWGNVNHGAFSSARLDTAIGTMNGEPSLANFVVGPSAGIAGDFDDDNDVDGRDFLLWQRDTGIGNLTEWQDHYDQPSGLASSLHAVPEPGSFVLICMAGVVLTSRRRVRVLL